MTTIEEKLQERGWTLPEAAAPIGSYKAWSKTRNVIYISGQLPFLDGEIIRGRLGDDMDVAAGAKAAEACAVGIVAQIKSALVGDYGRIRDIVKLEGFVNAVPEFTDHPEVINGASDLMADLFCGRGTHCRTAVGVSSLPRGAAVEIAAIVSVA